MTEKSKRGFASMDPTRLRSIAALGGSKVPPHKRSFNIQNPELAKEAGRKGGKVSPKRDQ